MKKSFLYMLCIMLCALLLFSGCGAMQTGLDTFGYETPQAESAEYAVTEETTESGDKTDSDTGLGDIGEVTVADTNRKLVYSMNLSINTSAFDEDYQEILAQLKAVDGYVEYEDVSGSKPTTATESGRYATLTLRVPVENYETFTQAIAGIGTVVSKSQQTEDYSDQYYDVDARIELLEEQKDRLMSHLESATEMKDIIDLENEIADVIYQLDDLKGQLRGMDRLVEYARVSITLNEYLLAENLTGSGEDTGLQAANAFAMTWQGMGEFFKAAGVGLAAAAPVLILLAVIAVAVIFIIKGIKVLQKKYKAHKAEKQQKQ